MRPKKFEVSYQAKAQVSRLSREEKDQLDRLFDDLDRQTHAGETASPGKTVSRLGVAKRVLWRMSREGKPTILSIVDLAMSD